MANVWGLDVDAVRTLGQKLEHEATAIDGILKTLTSMLANTAWTGPDSVQFRNEWDSQHSVQLRNVAEALRTTSSAARRNADEQERISQ